MRKAIVAGVSLGLLANLAEARGVKHPFVGEHADASGVHRKDSATVSMRLGAKSSSYSKMGSFVTSEGLFENEPTMMDQLYNSVFGEYQIEFSQKLAEHLESKSRVHYKKRLG